MALSRRRFLGRLAGVGALAAGVAALPKQRVAPATTAAPVATARDREAAPLPHDWTLADFGQDGAARHDFRAVPLGNGYHHVSFRQRLGDMAVASDVESWNWLGTVPRMSEWLQAPRDYHRPQPGPLGAWYPRKAAMA